MKSCPLLTTSLENSWIDLAHFYLIVCNLPNEVFTEKKNENLFYQLFFVYKWLPLVTYYSIEYRNNGIKNELT